MTLAVSPMAPAPVPLSVSLTEWHAEAGDRFVVDTEKNEGYLVHADGRYAAIPVVTGRRKFICYIGRCYNGATPTGTWKVKSRDIKGDHITFGSSGRFLRLYKDGEESTAYGIHEYGYEEKMFSGDDRFKSMGCIIVKKAVMDILDATYTLNGEDIDVITQENIVEPVSAAFPK